MPSYVSSDPNEHLKAPPTRRPDQLIAGSRPETVGASDASR
jgi:hypothetical protein